MKDHCQNCRFWEGEADIYRMADCSIFPGLRIQAERVACGEFVDRDCAKYGES